MTAAVIIAVAALVRVLLNNANGLGRADEWAMHRMATAATAQRYSYRQACLDWFADPELRKFPGIIRFGNVLLIGGLFRLFRTVSLRVMSSVSTVAGIGSVVLTWVIAGRLAPGSETIAAALAASSPLQLHLGRRALQDELVCCLTLAGIAAGITGHPILATLSLAYLLACKETTLTVWPALAGCFWMAGVPLAVGAAILIAAPALYYAAFCVLSLDPLLFFRFFGAVTSARHDAYARTQEGPPHRLPTDLFLLGPLACLAAARSDLTPAIAFVLLFLGTHAVVPILRSVRMVTASDAMMRVAAAAVVSTWSPTVAVAFVAASVASEVWIFRRVFVTGGVYDPITLNITHALGMAPRA